MGSIPEARDPDSVLRALQVSFIEGTKSNDREIRRKGRWLCIQKNESVPEKAIHTREKKGGLCSQVSSEGIAVSIRYFLRDSTFCLKIVFAIGWYKNSIQQSQH